MQEGEIDPEFSAYAASLNVLNLSPTATLPAMTGGQWGFYNIAKAFLQIGAGSILVGTNKVYDLKGGETPLNVKQHRVSRKLSGALALLKGGHYNETRWCTPAWRSAIEDIVSSPSYNFLFVHFLWTYPLIKDLVGNRPLVINTHNSEWEWYDKLARSSPNPLVKRVCATSKRRSDEILAMLPKGTIMSHVQVDDAAEYRRRRPDLTHVVLHNGWDSAPMRERAPDYGAPKKRLLFFGALGVQPNQDALVFFAEKFWPKLSDISEMVVAGSKPPDSVRTLCAANGWDLRPNLPAQEINSLYETVHYALSPHDYGVGQKSKLIDACGRGVPVLTTSAGAIGTIDLPASVMISDSPDEWRNCVLSGSLATATSKSDLLKYVKDHSWAASLRVVLDAVREAKAAL